MTMESVYILERTAPIPYRFLGPNSVRSRPGPRPPIPPIDTLAARTRFNRTPKPQSRPDDSPSTPSPHSPADDATPCPSPSTAFTTPEASPQAKFVTLVDQLLELRAENARVEARVEGLQAQVDVWIKRYLTEIVRGRQEEEQRHAHGGGLAVGAGSD